MGKVSFIADTHFGHKAICKYRPEFSTPQEHDEHIIECWNKVTNKKNDYVWVLGDFCIKNEDYDMSKLIDRLNGNIFLITGNHCHLPYYNHPKITIINGLYKKYGFWLSHVPIHPQELMGKKNIHGHTHYKSVKDTRCVNDVFDNRYISVCCEKINYTPITLDEVRSKYV